MLYTTPSVEFVSLYLMIIADAAILTVITFLYTDDIADDCTEFSF